MAVEGGEDASFADLFALRRSSASGAFASAAEGERLMMKRLSQSSPLPPNIDGTGVHTNGAERTRKPVGGGSQDVDARMNVVHEDAHEPEDEQDEVLLEEASDGGFDAEGVDDDGGISGTIPFHDSQNQFMARARLAATILDDEVILEAVDASVPVVPPSAAPGRSARPVNFPTPGLMGASYLAPPPAAASSLPSTAAKLTDGPGGYQDSFLTPLVTHRHGSNGGGSGGGVGLGVAYGERHLASFPVRDAGARRAELDRREKELRACSADAEGGGGGLSKVIATALGFAAETEGGAANGVGGAGSLSEAWQLSQSGRPSMRTMAHASATSVSYAWQRWYEVTLARRNPRDHHYYSSAMVRARLRLVGRYGYERYRTERLRLSCWRMATMLSRARRRAAMTLASKRTRSQTRLLLRQWHNVVGGRREEEVASWRRESRVLRASVRAWRASVVALRRRETLAECHRAGLERRQCLRCIASWRRRTSAARGARRLAGLAAEWRTVETLGRAMREWKRVALSRSAGMKRLFIARRLEQLVLARMSMRAWLSVVVQLGGGSDPSPSSPSAAARRDNYISARAQRLIDDLKAELARAQSRQQALRRTEDEALDAVFAQAAASASADADNSVVVHLEAEVARLQRELAAQHDSGMLATRDVQALSVDVEGERARASRLKEALDAESQRCRSREAQLGELRSLVHEMGTERQELRRQVDELSAAVAAASRASKPDDATEEAEAEVAALRAELAVLRGELDAVRSESRGVDEERTIVETSLIEAEEDLQEVVDAKAALEEVLAVRDARVLEETRRAESLEEALRQAELDHAAVEEELRLELEEQRLPPPPPDEDDITVDEYNAALDEAELREIELNEDREVLGQSCDELTQELAAAHSEISALELTCEELRASLNRAETATAQAKGELAVALIQLESMEKQNNELHVECESLQESQKLQRRGTIHLESELGSTRRDLEAIRADRDRLGAAISEERATLEGETRSVRANLEADVKALRVEKERLSATISEERAAVEAREEKVMRELSDMRDSLQSLRSAIFATEMAVRKTNRVDESEDLDTKLTFVRERFVKLSRELNDVRTSEAEVTKSLHIERRISESSQDDMLSLRTKQNQLQELLDATNDKVIALERELKQREVEVTQLREAETTATSLRRHRDALLAEVRDLRQQLESSASAPPPPKPAPPRPTSVSSAAPRAIPAPAHVPRQTQRASSTSPPSGVGSPHRRGSFRKASIERWRTGSFESKSPTGSIDSSSSRGPSVDGGAPRVEAPVDDGGLLDQRLDAEDLIAMQAEDAKVRSGDAPPLAPPPPSAETTPKGKRKIGAFRLKATPS